MTQRQEARLYHRAIKERWEIPDTVKVDVINELHIIATEGIEESSRIAACRAILMAEGQNQRDESSRQAEFAQRVIEIANRLGINIGDGGTGQTTSQRAITGRQ